VARKFSLLEELERRMGGRAFGAEEQMGKNSFPQKIPLPFYPFGFLRALPDFFGGVWDYILQSKMHYQRRCCS